MREDGRLRLRPSYPARRVRQEGHLGVPQQHLLAEEGPEGSRVEMTDQARTKDGQGSHKGRTKSCTIARPPFFILFFRHTFWRFYGT